MPRRAINTDDTKIEQKAPIIDDVDLKDREPDVVRAEQLPEVKYLDELAFNEDPVTICLEPSAEKNAATAFPVWVNGKGCEVFQNGRWEEIGYLPVNRNLIIKRKYLEVLVRTKIDTVSTDVRDRDSERPINSVNRFTSAVHSISIIKDANPLGIPWLQELRRRNA